MLKAFHEKLILFTSKPRWDDRPVKEYEVGNDWLGNILLGFLGSAESYKCRGTISGIGVDEAYSLVTFSTQTAWAPMTDMWDAIIESCFSDECGRPQLSYVYVAEEPNMDIFINTDINHEIFKEMYLLDDGDAFDVAVVEGGHDVQARIAAGGADVAAAHRNAVNDIQRGIAGVERTHAADVQGRG